MATSLWGRLRDAIIDTPAKSGSGGSGPGVVALTYDTPISTLANNPQRKAREAMAAFRTPWVFTAERAVSSVASTVDWHLENDADETIGDESSEVEQAALAFMRNPMPAMRLSQRQVWALTLRHAGLVGYTFWYLDQRDLLAGTPLSALYIRPDRMLPAEDKAGNLVGWVMDGDRPNGRQPVGFGVDEIAVFRLEPPDEGHLGLGLVEAAWRKLAMSGVVDRHSEKMIASGGRLAGLISPKVEKGSFSTDEYDQIVREMRNVTDSPDAAKKALIFKVPVDFKPTAATPSQMNLPDLMRGTRDDIFAIWGVALSAVGVASPRGLNSGNIPKFEEAATWQNAREPRLSSFAETLQHHILDRYALLGANVALELETPSFDDDTPLYEIADKAKVEPLTMDERRALVGKDPLDPAVYGALGNAIFMDQSMVQVFGAPLLPEAPVKASVDDKLTTLRSKIEVTWEPRLRRTVSAFLDKQRTAIVARVKDKAAHLAAEPKDSSAWWNGARWDRELRDALLADEEQLAIGVRARVAKTLTPGKADPLDTLLAFIRARTGERVTGINQTTRDDIARLVEEGVAAGLAPDELAQLIADSTSFDAARAELISRTETMLAYNDSALRTYQDFAVEEVEAIDGDQDEVCAARNGSRFSIDEAYAISDHPNGTLDWVPISPARAALDPLLAVKAQLDQLIARDTTVNVYPPANVPDVIVQAPPPAEVTVNLPEQAAPVVNVNLPEPKKTTKRIIRDEKGAITGIEES